MSDPTANETGSARETTASSNRFSWLFAALVLVIAGYPYFGDSTLGRFLGYLTSLLVVLAGVFAVRTNRRIFVLSAVLATLTLVATVREMFGGARNDAVTEFVITAFYGFTTIAVFRHMLRDRPLNRDAIFGIVSVYLLIGLSFGSLYDLVESLYPGSYRWNVVAPIVEHVGFRELLFYSFMTLTTIGYGDITPATTAAQSLAILEGVTGVLYVAVLVARIVNAFGGPSDQQRR